MGNRLDGKAISAKVRGEVKEEVASFVRQHGRAPGLTVVLVGEDPASQVYTRMKEKKAKEVGLSGELIKLPETTPQEELLALITELNTRTDVDGILVQLPLPKHIDDTVVLDSIDPSKDVDGFHPYNVGGLSTGRDALVACTPTGCMRLLEEAGVELSGAAALVVGRSNIVGKPMAQLLLAKNCTVTIAHSRTKNLPELCAQSDIVVAAVGRAKMISGDWIKPGATVIDVGVNRNEEGKLVGDVDYEGALEKAAWVTPVPGGVGPMTIACLLLNTLRAAQARVAK